MKIGGKVRVIGIPPDLPDDEQQTKKIFELCLGRVFPIESLEHVEGLPHELIQLLVGEVVGEPDFMHSIWIEPEFVEAVPEAD